MILGSMNILQRFCQSREVEEHLFALSMTLCTSEYRAVGVVGNLSIFLVLENK